MSWRGNGRRRKKFLPRSSGTSRGRNGLRWFGRAIIVELSLCVHDLISIVTKGNIPNIYTESRQIPADKRYPFLSLSFTIHNIFNILYINRNGHNQHVHISAYQKSNSRLYSISLRPSLKKSETYHHLHIQHRKRRPNLLLCRWKTNQHFRGKKDLDS